MSICIVPELQDTLAHIKEELDKESGNSSDMVIELLRKELLPVFEELSKRIQCSGESENEQTIAEPDRIESVISRLFEVLSDIRSESSLINVDDFDKYVEELRKLTKPLGMKIYCYKNGESIPEEDLSILELRYQQTNDSNLDKRVCSTECIGFRLNDLDMKRSAKVTVYGFREDYDSTAAELTKISHLNCLLQKVRVIEQEKNDILSEVKSLIESIHDPKDIGSFVENIHDPKDIDSEQKLILCSFFGEACPSHNRGRFVNCLGKYYENLSEKSRFEALKWYRLGSDNGDKHSKKRVNKMKKLKRR